ncbi:MAG TPA: hypothetical protein VM308_03415 [Sphingomicrobium sp.]|nr:hypothetical protein [Sphingomicrobium sp.]
MKRLIPFTALAALGATSAQATGGMTCKTAGPRAIEVSVGFGHVAGAPIIASRLIDNGRAIPVRAPQWWLDNQELRLVLTDPAGQRREAIIKTRRNGLVYDGSLWRGAQRRWVRCRES